MSKLLRSAVLEICIAYRLHGTDAAVPTPATSCARQGRRPVPAAAQSWHAQPAADLEETDPF